MPDQRTLLVNVPGVSGAWNTNITSMVSPAATKPTLQVTAAARAVHVPSDVVAETKVMPAGIGSFTFRLFTIRVLVKLVVYAIGSPAVTGLGACDRVTVS